MDTLMSDILAVAFGKEPTLSPCHDVRFHGEGFLTTEAIQRDMLTEPVEAPPSPVVDQVTYYTTPTPASEDHNSYHSYVDSPSLDNGSSSSYVRSDFYHLSPPSSPEITSTSNAVRRLPFTIDSILAETYISSDHNAPEGNTMSLTSVQQFGFSYDDWTSFQRYRSERRKAAGDDVTTPSSRYLYWCHVCGDTCADATDADSHETYHRANADTCSLQRHLFTQYGFVSAHVETGYHKVKCGLCLKMIARHFFDRHIGIHDGHICSTCGQEFPTRARLRDHVNGHTGSRPHSCDVCHLAFSDRRHLRSHSRRHRPCTYHCSFCSKAFRSKYACVIHERIHTGIKPFSCQEPGCRKSFTQKIQLQLHSRLHKC